MPVFQHLPLLVLQEFVVGQVPHDENDDAEHNLEEAQELAERFVVVELGLGDADEPAEVVAGLHALAAAAAQVFFCVQVLPVQHWLAVGDLGALDGLREGQEHQVLHLREDEQHVEQHLQEGGRGLDRLLVLVLLLLHLELELLLLVQQAGQLRHRRLTVHVFSEVLLGRDRQLARVGVLREVHAPDFVLDAHVDAADFDLEEVVGVFGGLVGHGQRQVLLEHLVLVRDVEHQDADVEPLLQLLVVQRLGGDEVFVVNLGQFEDLVVARLEVPLARAAFELLLVLRRDDLRPHLVALHVHQPFGEDLLLDALGDLVEDFEVFVVLVAFVQRVDQDHRFLLDDRNQLRVVLGVEAQLLQLQFLLEVVEHVARSVEPLLLHDLDLVQAARALDELDQGVDDLDADRQLLLVDDIEVPALDLAQQVYEVARLGGDLPVFALFAHKLLQRVVVVFAQILQKLQNPEVELLSVE